MRLLFKPWAVKYLLRLWPPYWGMGIRIQHVSEDFRQVVVTMKFAWWNRNYVGTQFGGSLFAMTDPFYMLMLHKALEPDYFVWDKAAHIDFMKPGKSKVTARFEINDAILEDIRKHTAGGEKYFKDLTVDIVDAAGEVVAKVRRTLYVRKKPHLREKK
jgi:acyl-coenzyme A thioesterase PaaI-like protein